MKLLLHLVIFFLGAALGVWWGVYHPVEAARVANMEQRTVDQAKTEISHLGNTNATNATTPNAASTTPPAPHN